MVDANRKAVDGARQTFQFNPGVCVVKSRLETSTINEFLTRHGVGAGGGLHVDRHRQLRLLAVEGDHGGQPARAGHGIQRPVRARSRRHRARRSAAAGRAQGLRRRIAGGAREAQSRQRLWPGAVRGRRRQRVLPSQRRRAGRAAADRGAGIPGAAGQLTTRPATARKRAISTRPSPRRGCRSSTYDATPGLQKDRCLVIGEVALAHDGSLGLAHAFIDAIARGGADAVKFQTHIAAAESTPAEPFRVKFSRQDATRYDYWKRMEFTEAQWKGLADHAREKRAASFSARRSRSKRSICWRASGMPMWKVGVGRGRQHCRCSTR